MQPLPEIIAEIGVNYYDIAKINGVTPIEAAIWMVREAKSAGIRVVKFQAYKAETLAAEYSPAYWDLNEEPTQTQKELFSKYDRLNYEDYLKIADACDRMGIEFMSTPFDAASAVQMNTLVKRHKIASADITNIELLSLIGSFGKPVLLSTGASTNEEIFRAINILNRSGASKITLLHCVLNYPTPPEKANLWKIKALKATFTETSTGYSDHTKFSMDVLLTAWLLGAEIVEKHFTLDKSLKGNDHYHAASPEDLSKLIQQFMHVQSLIGQETSYGYDPSEETSRRFARRGVYLVRDVCAGETLHAEDVTFLRPQNEGISPIQWMDRLSKHEVYVRNMKNGELIV